MGALSLPTKRHGDPFSFSPHLDFAQHAVRRPNALELPRHDVRREQAAQNHETSGGEAGDERGGQ